MMENKQKKKKRWQEVKEGWYSHIKVSLRTLDIIIGVGIAVLAIVFVLIALEATGTFYLFG